MSQSAVTVAIRQLETISAYPCSTGSRAACGSPPRARASSAAARNIMAAVDDALHPPLREQVSETGRIRIGVTYTVAGYFLPRHHVRFRQTFPSIAVELIEMPRELLEQALMDGEIDMAVMLVSNLGNHRDIEFETLLRSRRRLWLPAGHELCRRRASASPTSRPRLRHADGRRGRPDRLPLLEAGRIAPKRAVQHLIGRSRASMVAAGMGVTVLSDMVYRPWSLEGQLIERRDLVEDIPTMDVGIAWKRDRRPQGAALTFLEHLSLTFGGAERGRGD